MYQASRTNHRGGSRGRLSRSLDIGRPSPLPSSSRLSR
jgi:hypothetical protein